MDKRFKRPLNQKANYSDPPYHHNASRGYQKHAHPHGHPHSHPHSHPHLHPHPNKTSWRNLQHGHSYQKGASAVGPNSYYKPPPPHHVLARNVGGGAMAPPSSGGNTSSDVVTLIVENNNLKRMIVLHLNLMQEQTDGLAAKDKELDDQNAKLAVILSQNQELKLANAKLEATVEDLRRQLRRKNKRPHDDDDDDDHSLPPTGSQRQQILCNAGTQTEMQEVYNRLHPVEPFPAQQSQAKMQPRIQMQKEQLHEERLSHVKPVHKAPSVATAARPLESKVRGEFNGKKVSTMILNRVNQDSSLTSAEHRIQEENDPKEEKETQQQKFEDIRLQREEEEEQQKLVEEQLHQDHEVISEEVVDDDIFHDALEPNEIEVATETIVGVDEEIITDANGHMDEENEDDSDDDSSDEEDDGEDNEDGDTDDSDETEEEEEPQLENNLDDFWNNQMNSMDVEEAEEKTIAPSGHSTPNHQPALAEEELETSTGSDRCPDQEEEEQVDQEAVVEQMEVDTIEVVTEEVVIDNQTTMEIEVHSEKMVSISRHLKLREHVASKDEKNDCNIREDEKDHTKPSAEDKQSPLKEEKKIREISTDENQHWSPLKEEIKIRDISTDEKQHRSPLKVEKKIREISSDGKQPGGAKDKTVLRDTPKDEGMIRKIPNDEGHLLETSETEKHIAPKSTNENQNQSSAIPKNEKLNQSRETSRDEKLKRVSKDQKSQHTPQSIEEKMDLGKEQKKDTITPKDLPKAIAPKAEIHSNPPSSGTNLPKANSVAVSPTPKVIGASVQQSASPAKPVANHQSNKALKAEPVKKQRLQVKIRQHDMFNDKKISLTASSTSTRDQKKEREPEINVNSTVKNLRDLDSSPMPKSEPEDDETLEERMRRKLQEHLQKEQRRQSQQPQVLLKKPSKESPTTHLIYPPIEPTPAAVSAATITPATTPTTTPSSTPVSTPHPTPASSQESSRSSTRSKQDKISLPLTPQSMSSVSSSSSSSITRPTKVVNNCAPHTYSKAPTRSKKSKSLYRTATYPYTTRSWEDQEFHCDNEFFLEEADELLADNPSLEIPKWRDDPVPPSSDKKGIEPLSDADFIRRHEKCVKDEIERKRRDARCLRDLIRSEALRSRRNQDEVLVTLDPLPTSTFYPLPEDIKAIQFVSEVPVQAFGENMINVEARDDFSLPWLDAVQAQTSIGKAKALAVPVATLASKKLPTNPKEARHQEMNSSYVYLKRRKRQRRR
ncbi:hypothetical protein KR074_005330 [Drosophila pseudoananassae]|nr:hypothetical protein KR074_005330 [Drosophila pseudoananassae]